MSKGPEYERRLRRLLDYLEDVIREGGRRRVSILVNGDEFGLSADELLLNPRGPIPEVRRRPSAMTVTPIDTWRAGERRQLE
jgi:hypothetical protein